MENAFNKTEVALDAALKATGLNTGAGSNGTVIWNFIKKFYNLKMSFQKVLIRKYSSN